MSINQTMFIRGFVRYGAFSRITECYRWGSTAVNIGASRTTSPEEVRHYNRLAHEWNNPKGKFKVLHEMNPHRMSFLLDYAGCNSTKTYPLSGLSVLDVGCGGGILSRALRDAGADVTGIDTSDETINVSNAALDLSPKSGPGTLHFEISDVESVVAARRKFDIVVASEVIEHVESPAFFFEMLSKSTKPGGTLILTTISKTPAAYLTIILAAEKLGFIPEGTHTYEKFVSPDTMKEYGHQSGVKYLGQRGLCFLPIANKFLATKYCGMNYLIAFRSL